MATKQLTYRIGMDIGELRRNAESAGTATRQFKRELAELEAKQRAHRQSLASLGVGMAGFGVAVAAGLGFAAKAAIDWEAAFAGVRKTVDGSDAEIDALEGSLRGLARTLPATHEEIAAVAEAAGQLGIKRQDIAEFTKTMIALGETTNLSADEASTALAQFMNIMGTSASDVDRLGASLVALGNAGASTEKDIISMGLRIAGAGHQVGLSEAQVLGFASALSSVGIEAEAGGSSFSRVMIDISSAVNDGGQQLDDFAQLAGMSTAQFSKAFKQDAGGAIIAFIQGLGRMSDSGGNVLGTLERLGFTEIRVRDALLRAAGASDMFTDSLKVGSRGWAENAALADEAAKRYQTTEAKLQVAGNQIKDALIDIGGAIAPIVAAGAQGVGDLVRFFQELPGPIKDVVTWVGVAVAGVTLFGGAALIAAPKVLAFRESMRTMAATGGAMSGALSKFGLFMSGPWGVGIGLAVGLLGVFGAAAGAASRKQQELADAGKSVAQAIAEQNGVINQAVRQSTAKTLAEKGILQQAKDLGIALPQVTDAVLGQGDAYSQLKAHLEAVINSNKASDASTNESAAIAGTATDQQVDAARILLGAIDNVKGGKEQELQAQEAAAEGAEKGADATKGQTGAMQELAVTTEEAAAALDAMVDALDRLNGTTLTSREAQREWIAGMGNVAASIKENGKSLDINTAKGQANLQVLDERARSANDLAEAVAKEAEAHGGAAAGVAALTASLQASRQALFAEAKQFGISDDAAWAYVDAVLAIPPEANTDVSTPGAKAAQAELQRVKDSVNRVPPKKDVNVGVLSQTAIEKLRHIQGIKVTTQSNGTVVVRAETVAAQKRLNQFVAANKNRTFDWSVRITMPNIRGPKGLSTDGSYNADGGIRRFAGGGMFGSEDHSPQIAAGGTWRVWAEDETEGETYLPWARSKRPGSLKYMRITARAWGYDVVPLGRTFAGGGVTGSALGAGMRALSLSGLAVQVFVGTQEITDIVDVRVTQNNRQTRRNIVSGSGNTR